MNPAVPAFTFRALLEIEPRSATPMAEAQAFGADAVILDITATGPGDEEAIRHWAGGYLGAGRQTSPPLRLVKVGPLRTEDIEADLDAVMPHAPDGIVLADTWDNLDLAHLGAKLAVREAECGLPNGSTRIIACVETARGFLQSSTLAGVQGRLAAVICSTAALQHAHEVPDASHDDRPPDVVRVARSTVLLAAAAAGVPAIDAGDRGLDAESLARSCRLLRKEGFAGRIALNPSQVGPILSAFDRPRREAGGC